MEQLYYFTGLIFIWILSFFGTLFIVLKTTEKLIEIAVKKFKSLAHILEYAYNRKEFKEWLKTKNEKK
jgi:hypothetical protein